MSQEFLSSHVWLDPAVDLLQTVRYQIVNQAIREYLGTPCANQISLSHLTLAVRCCIVSNNLARKSGKCRLWLQQDSHLWYSKKIWPCVPVTSIRTCAVGIQQLKPTFDTPIVGGQHPIAEYGPYDHAFQSSMSQEFLSSHEWLDPAVDLLQTVRYQIVNQAIREYLGTPCANQISLSHLTLAERCCIVSNNLARKSGKCRLWLQQDGHLWSPKSSPTFALRGTPRKFGPAFRQKALADLKKMQTDDIEKLSDIQCQPESQLKFIIEAWLQIVECRRVLKWTYAYGFYIPDHEHGKREFFEYLQGEAESGLERLHQCAEKELKLYFEAKGPSEDFNEFRTKLAGLTSVTKNYFENLVRALENGLPDVNSHGAYGRAASSKNKGPTSRASSSDSGGQWACERCTLVNPKWVTICQICEHGR
ncbi:hypothetical protein F2Q68_00008369 [Brassica cretica]|uniref:RanBP2-type domain-containing protein n=1 Tax=Brassica cretica TaxID=69181 RepID=A0A8S9KQL5_BRACR|nr:hypothetical protein F2Q68_00008369 [Brassica cretica]